MLENHAWAQFPPAARPSGQRRLVAAAALAGIVAVLLLVNVGLAVYMYGALQQLTSSLGSLLGS